MGVPVKKRPEQGPGNASGDAPAVARAKGNTHPRANELVPFEPFLDGEPDRVEPWYPTFLVALAKYGRITLAAATAKVHRRVAYRHIETNRALAAEVDAAKAHYRSALEYGLAHQFHIGGNVLAGFGALKAELPSRYIEKNVSMNVDVSPDLLPSDLGPLLSRLLAQLSPEARKMLVPAREGEPPELGPVVIEGLPAFLRPNRRDERGGRPGPRGARLHVRVPPSETRTKGHRPGAERGCAPTPEGAGGLGADASTGHGEGVPVIWNIATAPAISDESLSPIEERLAQALADVLLADLARHPACVRSCP